MDPRLIVKISRNMGCCDSCCLRFVGVKSPSAYTNCHNHILPYLPILTNGDQTSESDQSDDDTPAANNAAVASVYARFPPDPQTLSKVPLPKRELDSKSESGPSAKRKKSDYCVTCLGILQKETWEEAADVAREVVAKKQYAANSFAAALSAPICTIYRERVVVARLLLNVPEYDPDGITSLKEGWKWSFAPYLARLLGMKLDSGKFAPLLITLNYEYPDDLQDLEILKTLSPAHFAERAQHRRFTVEFTRRSVIEALEDVEDSVLAVKRLKARTLASCVSVVACHEPVYLAGRYIKLSRWLPQTPWLVQGRRMVASSVQDIIFTPIARLYGMAMEDIEHRLKFMSAGREDVDVRCLGEGRPFAIEISDPRRMLTAEELAQVCEEISQDKQVVVNQLVHVHKEALVQLKGGEEVKSKTYEALVVKLKSANDTTPLKFMPCPVTDEDLNNINKFAPITILQRTPLRVLHRRPLLTRRREVYELHAQYVENEPNLIKIRLRTEAGTYVKEFVHGECGRTQPSLADALKPPTKQASEHTEKSEQVEKEEKVKNEEIKLNNIKESQSETDKSKGKNNLHENEDDLNTENMIRFDILALDVDCVHLEWPII